MLGISVATETTSTFEQIINGLGGKFDGIDFSNINFEQFYVGITNEISAGATRSLDNFVIDLPNISFKDMSGDEIQKELEAIFSQQADLMAQYLVPQIGEFQQAGEGLYDTLLRVAQEQTIFNSVLELTAQSLNSIDAYAQIEVAQSIVEFAGSIEALQSAANTYLNEFFTDAEQFDFLTTQLNSQFAALNTSLPKTRDGFKDLLSSLDLTKESDQRLYAALMLLIPQLDGYYDAIEKQAEAERKLADNRRAFVVDLQSQLDSFDMSALELSIRDVNNWRDNAIASAKDLGVTDFSLIEKLAGKKREKIVEDTLKQIISNTENKMTKLVSNFDNNVNALTSTLEQLTNAIKSTSASIGGEILNIQKTLPSFNGVVFFGAKASGLQGQLGSQSSNASASSQLSIIEQLKTALVEKYNAEQGAINDTQTLLNDKYQTELDVYQTQLDAINSLRDAALSLKKAASDLLVGDLSPLTMSQQLSEAQSQFNSLVAKAKNGDVNAYNDIQNSGSNYLKIAQQYDPANYQSIFDSVYGTFNSLGDKAFGEPTAPAPNPATSAYQQQSEQLALATINELQSLQSLTESLTTTAQAEYNISFSALQTQFANDSADIINTMETSISDLRALLPEETDLLLAKMQEQIDAIFAMSDAVVGAVVNIEPPVINLPEQPAPIIKLPRWPDLPSWPDLPTPDLPPWLIDAPIWWSDAPEPPKFDVPLPPPMDLTKFGAAIDFSKIVSAIDKTNAKLDVEAKLSASRNKAQREQIQQQAEQLKQQAKQIVQLKKLDKSFIDLGDKVSDSNNEVLTVLDRGAA